MGSGGKGAGGGGDMGQVRGGPGDGVLYME